MSFSTTRVKAAFVVSLLLIGLLLLLLSTTASATFPGSNGKIVYTTTSNNGAQFNIRVIKPDGTGKKKLISNGFEPVWSPNGKKIAFSRPVSKNSPTNSIWVMNSDGSNAHKVISGTRSVSVDNPSWSPGGGKLVYVRSTLSRGERTSLFTAKSNGKEQKRLLVSPRHTHDEFPAWSPNGNTIAFVRTTNASSAVLTIPASGNGSPNSISSGNSEYMIVGDNAEWAPDGSRLAVTAMTRQTFLNAIGFVSPSQPNTLSILPANSGIRLPFLATFSPNQAQLLISGGNGLFITDLNGQNQKLLDSKGSEGDWQSR